MNENVRQRLREAYKEKVAERDARATPAWEAEERDNFVALLREERKRTLLELGAATGSDGKEFQDHGFEVVCIDLSPEMVGRCREKGLQAHVMDAADLRFPDGAFDAVYAMNCLVHVPESELPGVLKEVSRVLTPGGIFYVGVYGGLAHEGSWADDPYEPKRFFSFHTDDRLREILEETFQVHTFRRIPHGWSGLHFQSITLRKPTAARQPRKPPEKE